MTFTKFEVGQYVDVRQISHFLTHSYLVKISEGLAKWLTAVSMVPDLEQPMY